MIETRATVVRRFRIDPETVLASYFASLSLSETSRNGLDYRGAIFIPIDAPIPVPAWRNLVLAFAGPCGLLPSDGLNWGGSQLCAACWRDMS